jgi:microcystin-dependent protein
MTQAINLANFSNSLDSSGGVPPTQLNAVVPISKGGTNASTVATARTSLDVYSTSETNSNITTAVANANPSGEIKMWPTATAPSGYFLCAGAAISRTTYATLFAVIGTTFGVGDGTTTFNLPDFRDRMPIGAGSTYSANSSGGSVDAIVVSHTHTTTNTLAFAGDALPAHSHTIVKSSGTSGTGVAAGNGGTTAATTSVSAGTPTGTITGSVTNASTGSSGTNANLPPYRGIYFIIKT